MKLHYVQISDTWLQLQSDSDGEKFAERCKQCGNILVECIFRIFLQVLYIHIGFISLLLCDNMVVIVSHQAHAQNSKWI